MRVNEQNINEFFEAVGKCNGDVYCNTTEGDRLNLKSQLTRYIFAFVIANKEFDKLGSIQATDTDDLEYLNPFM